MNPFKVSFLHDPLIKEKRGSFGNYKQPCKWICMCQSITRHITDIRKIFTRLIKLICGSFSVKNLKCNKSKERHTV